MADPAFHYTGTLVRPDGTSLFEQTWMPDGDPDGLVLIVHGYAEHSGRYRHVATHLTRQGYAVVAYDQRGHGRSGGDRGYVDHFSVYVEDLVALIHRVRQRHPEIPLALLGHSMGGLVTALAVIDHEDLPVRALLLSSPAAIVSVAPGLQRLANWLGRYLPRLPTVPMDRRSLSRDPAVVEQAERDPLNLHQRTLARTGAELVLAGRRLRARADELTLPLLLFHGTADPLIDAEGSRVLHERASSSDKTLRLFEGLYHETLNEPEKDEVLALITDWLAARMQPVT